MRSLLCLSLSLSLSLGLSLGISLGLSLIFSLTLPAGSQEKSQATASQVCARASDLLTKREFRQALELLDEAIEDENDHPDELIKNPDSGSAEVKRPDLARLLLLRGRAYYLFCNYKRSIEDLDHALALEPRLSEALLQKAICLARLGQTEAKDIFAKDWQLMAADPRCALLTAQGLYEWGMKDQAILALKDLNDSASQKLREQMAKNIIGERTVTASDQTTTGFNTILAGKYFVLYSDINKEKSENYLELADAIIDYFRCRFGSDLGIYPCGLFILHDKFAGRTFLESKMNFPTHVHGVYMARRNALVTYDGAGVGTFIHEIMHKYLDRLKLEYWAEEGIPSAFEKVWGYIDDSQGRLKLMVLPRNDLPEFIERHQSALTVRQIVEQAKHANPEHEEAQALLGLFLLHENKLEKYIELAKANGRDRNLLSAAFNKSDNEIEVLFKQYLDQILALKAQVSSLPSSRLFDSKEEFENFRRLNQGKPDQAQSGLGKPGQDIAGLQSQIGN